MIPVSVLQLIGDVHKPGPLANAHARFQLLSFLVLTYARLGVGAPMLYHLTRRLLREAPLLGYASIVPALLFCLFSLGVGLAGAAGVVNAFKATSAEEKAKRLSKVKSVNDLNFALVSYNTPEAFSRRWQPVYDVIRLRRWRRRAQARAAAANE